MVEAPKPLTQEELNKFAEDFVTAVDKGNYKEILTLAKKANASREDVQRALEGATQIVERRLIDNAGDIESNFTNIAALGVGGITVPLVLHLVRWASGHDEKAFMAGMAAGVAGGFITRFALMKLEVKQTRERLRKLSRAQEWWSKQMMKDEEGQK